MEDSKPVGYFQEDNGGNSSMRVMCFISLMAAIGAAAIILLRPIPVAGSDGIFIFFGFLLGAFAPKALQKMAEQKVPNCKDGQL